MPAYSVQVLHLSEAEAYLRIAVARASRRFPVLLVMLADGRLHLSAIAKLAPHLDRDNSEELLSRAVHKTKHEIEMLIAEVAPRPDVPSRMRKLPRKTARRHELSPDAVDPSAEADLEVSSPSGSPASPGPQSLRLNAVETPARPAVIEPTAPTRYRVEFTASAELRDKLCRAQALLRHKLPDGDLAGVVDEALTLLLHKLEGKRFGKTRTPRKALEQTDTSASSRHIPAAVKRSVYERDGGRCAFVNA
ncbi:MAG: hypothetical protein JRF63_16505, partial [Deltaproteobacteria bacterium]|nr:hypothetical protein [Deltaproteobacteria bacterium]